MGFPDRLLAAVLLATLFPAAASSGPRPSAAQCDRAKLAGRAYIECLEKALRDSDEAVGHANRRAHTAIDARSDLAPTQRTRWKNTLDEAQGLFVRFRNFECQNVAPYEGGSRIGAFEERLACLVDKNLMRLEELRRRYDVQ
ncbi:MAG TPA: lysozyme inhibitor LprI family protein [Xanthobacteraceae bacterium]|nr:lysozyme inhibitor LprI family protein [Xanthobacteraceae bacterium]